MRSVVVNVHNSTLRNLKSFYAEQDKWTRTMIKNHPHEEDAFWRHVAYIMAQFDGLYAGYRAVALPEWVTGFLLLSFVYVPSSRDSSMMMMMMMMTN